MSVYNQIADRKPFTLDTSMTRTAFLRIQVRRSRKMLAEEVHHALWSVVVEESA